MKSKLPIILMVFDVDLLYDSKSLWISNVNGYDRPTVFVLLPRNRDRERRHTCFLKPQIDLTAPDPVDSTNADHNLGFLGSGPRS